MRSVLGTQGSTSGTESRAASFVAGDGTTEPLLPRSRAADELRDPAAERLDLALRRPRLGAQRAEEEALVVPAQPPRPEDDVVLVDHEEARGVAEREELPEAI